MTEKDSLDSNYKQAVAEFEKKEFIKALNHVNKTVDSNPQNIDARALRAQIFINLGRYTLALQEYYFLLTLAPNNLFFRSRIRTLHTQLVDRWHPIMLNDQNRNLAFEKAINQLVKPGMLVIEIGTGSGILAMLAARAGAAHVYTIEQSFPLANVAAKIIQKNGLADKITVLNCWSEDIKIGQHIPERADLLIAEIIGASLIDEHLLRFLNHARLNLVKPGAKIIPAQGTLFGAFVESTSIQERVKVKNFNGLDLSLFNALFDEASEKVTLQNEEHKILSETFKILDLKFDTEFTIDTIYKIQTAIIETGVAHGIAMWFELTLANEIKINTSPFHPKTHWGQLVQVFDNPLDCKAGTKVSIAARFYNDRFSFSLNT